MKARAANWNRSKFVEYLINIKGLSPRGASDIASRCLRVEACLKVCLISECSNIDNLSQLHLDISRLGVKLGDAKESSYRIASSLRSAVNHFSEYKWGIRVPPHSIFIKHKN